jgi:Double-GTPase 2
MSFLVAVCYVVYLVTATPLAAVVACAVYAVRIPGTYLLVLARVLVIRPAWLPEWKRPPRAAGNADPAVLQYFYGPAAADADLTVRLAYADCRRFWNYGAGKVVGSFTSAAPWFTGPLGVGGAAGMATGTLFGAAVAAGCAVIHLLVVAILAGLARAAGSALRGIDSVVLRIRHIKMFCPVCFERVPYPGYVCTGDGHHPHHDVRPGRFGIVRRRCQCGQPMNTLLLFGSAKMSAFCPHCDNLLEHRPGEAPEIVLPFFGAVGAGKTRLLFSAVTQLQSWDGTKKLKAEFADSVTTRELAAAEDILRSGTSTWATPPELPRAHVIRLSTGKDTCILHMFDAAGERFYTAERTRELGYLGKSKTFVLVIDPLSVGPFWARLPPGRQADLKPVRSTVPSPDLAFHQALQSIEAMGVRPKEARLAVVFSKADQFDPPDGDVAVWADRELGLGNLVRSVKIHFKESAFMCAAAVMEDKGIHESIATLLRWMLADESVRLPGSMS